MQHSRILAKLKEALLDNYPRGVRDKVLAGLERLYGVDHPYLDLTVPWRHDEP